MVTGKDLGNIGIRMENSTAKKSGVTGTLSAKILTLKNIEREALLPFFTI